MVFSDNLSFADAQRVVDLQRELRLPVMFDPVSFVEAGGLVSYGADLAHLYARAATSVDRILRGASPATLPVEQATEFELGVNLKAHRQLGLPVPASVLFRADPVLD